MDAITLLKDDHRTVEQLFKRFEQAGDRAHVQKRQIVDRIIEELSVHAAIEEQVFYPVARATVPDTEDIALESLEEHHVVKWLLSELVDMDPAHERFDAKVTVLIENVRHHVEEEESEFFPKVRKQLGRNELADLGEALADAKKSAPTRPHPRMPDAGPANVVAERSPASSIGSVTTSAASPRAASPPSRTSSPASPARTDPRSRRPAPRPPASGRTRSVRPPRRRPTACGRRLAAPSPAPSRPRRRPRPAPRARPPRPRSPPARRRRRPSVPPRRPAAPHARRRRRRPQRPSAPRRRATAGSGSRR